MVRFCLLSLGSLLLIALLCPLASAEETNRQETNIDVRVLSKGAKFIGTSMGGMEVLIHDADSGELLAKGLTAGSTGDTDKIMKTPQPHHAPVSTEDAAVYRAALKLEEPRRLKISARGPLTQPQAIQTVTATQWVVPGKHITGGDAFTLEMPGFVVDILSPPAHQKLAADGKTTIDLTANVTMMCGCPIEPDGLWDANRFEVTAIVKRDGQRARELPLRYAGQTSQFAAKVELDGTGSYEFIVYAFDPENGNTGLDKASVVVP